MIESKKLKDLLVRLCSIKEDGTLSDFAYDALGKKFLKHPDGGNFNDVKFDFMDKVTQMYSKPFDRVYSILVSRFYDKEKRY